MNNAKVTQPDIPASNDIVHLVDQVLLPLNFPASLNTSPRPPYFSKADSFQFSLGVVLKATLTLN
ncbi:fasciclin domain-containing protein [Nostoc sp.]|uniref:fasciclin domain-containing protein n=1 Tax=Nostoc sp. TaxID=1180 RepID=UPI0026279734|nr:fasciclin domain-containing protein [Nostoc sp. S13]MDF5735623.1 fasciclin domain-containing protein [Nostoc sp. S13]